MSGVSDEEIVRAVRAIAELEERREALAERVGELRLAAAPEELAERDRTGTEMAAVTDLILLECVETLDRLGLTTAAQAVQHMIDEEGLADEE
ncbi:hypothetical protein [Streptomyces sp. DH12]|uniref:hypothetical protein n=1 Tax=Streptomyces sp. DH12 TaxID=2857010 RepID=UPI001E42D8DA|nr:hypothetical protein [Streptomyces sp. DH12]